MKKEKEESPIKDVIKDVLRYDVWLKILTITSMGLIIAGFCVPPMGIIDGSVLIGTGELAGFAALFETGHAINKGLDARVKIKDIELQIHNDELKEEKIEHLDHYEEIYPKEEDA
jgi:hypothetical protein